MVISVLLIIIILNKDTGSENISSHQRISRKEDFKDLTYRDFESQPIKEHVSRVKNVMEPSNAADSTKRELQEAKAKIELLEKKLAILEGRIPQKYPDVKYLGYKERKRILVSGL